MKLMKAISNKSVYVNNTRVKSCFENAPKSSYDLEIQCIIAYTIKLLIEKALPTKCNQAGQSLAM